MEPSYFITNALSFGLPFLAYFCGIFIRKFAMPSKQKTRLSHQLLLGIPVSLVIVSPFMPILYATSENAPGYLLTIGLIMEHGMLVNETATRHLAHHLSRSRGEAPAQVTGPN